MELTLLHGERVWQRGSGKISLEYWRKQATAMIVESLRPGPAHREPLTVRDDGTVMQGNTRLKVLLERGFPVDQLPYVPYP